VRLRIFAAVLSAALAVGSAAIGAGDDSKPDWLRKPTARELIAVWPPTAWQKGVGGKATIKCVVSLQGALRDCQVLSETPAGEGFGQAAIALTPQMLFRPGMKDGRPIENGTVTLPIIFNQPDTALGTRLRGPGPYDSMPLKLATGVVWEQAPAVAEVLAAFPAKARDQKVTGHVTFDCMLKDDGRLSACKSIQEEPAGYGFIAAAKGLAGKFVGPTLDSSGQSLKGAHVHLMVTFPAEAIGASEPVIGKPHWTQLPAAADFAATFTDGANKAKVNKARVVLSCRVGEGGALQACQPVSEDPAGFGLGVAAAALASKFKVGVWTDEGLPTVGGRVRVPLVYNLTDAAPPPAASTAGGGRP